MRLGALIRRSAGCTEAVRCSVSGGDLPRWRLRPRRPVAVELVAPPVAAVRMSSGGRRPAARGARRCPHVLAILPVGGGVGPEVLGTWHVRDLAAEGRVALVGRDLHRTPRRPRCGPISCRPEPGLNAPIQTAFVRGMIADRDVAVRDEVKDDRHMPDTTTSEAGTVEAVFAHRFVLKRKDGTRLLADLGPKGADAFRLVEGAEVSIEGEAKPSELKVSRLTPKGGEPIAIPHGKPHDDGHDHRDADPEAALAAVRQAGLEPIGSPRRKPKHFEVLARRAGDLLEVHVEPNGRIRKEKPADEEKWADVLARD